jgi:hypothetical protein
MSLITHAFMIYVYHANIILLNDLVIFFYSISITM